MPNIRRPTGSRVVPILAVMVATTGALAAGDDPTRAVCALQQVIACAPFEPCDRTLPEAMNLPVLLTIDRAGGAIVSSLATGAVRSSTIGSRTVDEATELFQGVDGGRPWSLRLDRATGRFTLTSAHPDAGFIGFGLCAAALQP